MRTYTYEQASDKVLKDLDMAEESFLDADELVELFNEAIREAESEIKKLGHQEDYFLTEDTISLVEGTAEYDLPDDLYGQFVRRLIYNNGSSLYPVKRIKDKYKFEEIEHTNTFDTSADYRYTLVKGADDSQAKIKLVPPSRETSSDVLKIFYIRSARVIPLIADGSEAATNATEIDFPEFISFIFAFVKFKIKQKAMEPIETYILELQRERQLMIDTLSEFADEDDEVRADLSHYMESS